MKMKRILTMLSLTAILVACNKPEPTPTPTLSIEPEITAAIDFIAAGETKTFVVNTNQKAWTVEPNQDWLTATVTETGFTLTAAANETTKASPAAKVFVMVPGCDIITIHCTQPAGAFYDFAYDMVLVEAGTFMMGAAEDDPEHEGYKLGMEMPQHQVTLTKNYYIGKYEVTKGKWAEIMGEAAPSADQVNIPINNVSYYEVQAFITKLNEMTGKTYRLPTEAEWEFAAAGGNQTHGYKYAGSDNLAEVAYCGNTTNGNAWAPTEVGTLAHNELGLYDMSGNVTEYCSDWYDVYLAVAQTDPTGSSIGTEHVVRGGAYDTWNVGMRLIKRTSFGPGYKSTNRGFRLVMSAE